MSRFACRLSSMDHGGVQPSPTQFGSSSTSAIMFAQRRCRPRRGRAHPVDDDRRRDARRRSRSRTWIVETEGEAARHDLRVGKNLGDAVDGTGRHARRFELRQQFGADEAARQPVQDRRQGVAMAHAVLAPCIGGIGGERRLAENIAELAELPVVAGRDDDVAVGDRKDVVGHEIGMAVAEPARSDAGNQIIQRLIAEHRHLRVEQGAIDEGALAGARAPEQGRLDGIGGIEAGEDIGDGDARFRRRPVGVAGEVHGPAHALNLEIVAGPGGVRPVLAEAADRADDEARIERVQAHSGRARISSGRRP